MFLSPSTGSIRQSNCQNGGEGINLTSRFTDWHVAMRNYTQIIGNHEVKSGAGPKRLWAVSACFLDEHKDRHSSAGTMLKFLIV
jgi:hypothetical protein